MKLTKLVRRRVKEAVGRAVATTKARRKRHDQALRRLRKNEPMT